jgi:hypothetical protein
MISAPIFGHAAAMRWSSFASMDPTGRSTAATVALTRILNRLSRASRAGPNPGSVSSSKRSASTIVTRARTSTRPVGCSKNVHRASPTTIPRRS